jgi:2-methylcitrate dehydratase PrpD
MVEKTTLTRLVADFITSATLRGIDKNVLEKAKIHTLDTFAAMISGAEMEPGKQAIKYARQFAGKEAGVLASKVRTDAITAALANGMTAHADETDDSNQFSLTHPGCAVVPAALAMAEREGSTGMQFLKAVTVGYDICARMGMALGGEAFVRSGKDSHAVAGAMGACAAAAALSGLNSPRVAVALSYASQQASGLATLFRDPGHVEKAFVFGGLPAKSGIAAVTMVQSGMTGIADCLDGAPNFFTANNALGDVAESFRNLGRPHEIARTNIKRWSVGSPAQAVLDALEALIVRYHVKPADVVACRVHLSPRSARVVDGREMPDINVQYLSAVMLLDGTVSFAASHDFKRMKNRQLLAMREKVTLVPDEVLEGVRPPRQAIAEIDLKNGRTVRHRARAVRGTADNPMTVEEVETKARDLIAPVLGSPRARAILRAVADLDKAKSIAKLVALMQGK